jgi:hypothetical protein
MSDFPELATRGWRLATSQGLRPMAFCNVVEVATSRYLRGKKRHQEGAKLHRCRAK